METTSGVWWCGNCHVPLLTPECEACGFWAGKPLAKDLVPVFSEEIALLREHLGMEQLPEDAGDFYLWSAGSSYYCCGRRVASFTYKTPGTPTIRLHCADMLGCGIRGRDREATIEAMSRANRHTLDALAFDSRTFVRETISRFPHHSPLVAFSGGKDSVAVSHIVRCGVGSPSVLHVFSDTSLEAPDTYDCVAHMFSEETRIPLVRLQPSVDFIEMCRRIGPPSRIHRWCCTSHKTAPMGVFIDLISSSGGSVTFDGIRRCESRRRSRYRPITLQHSKLAMQISASPILDWSDLALWLYTLENRLPVNRAYLRGFRRVGCISCPYVGDWADFLTATHYPEEHSAWRAFLLSYAKLAGLADPDAFAVDTWRGRARGNELDKSGSRISSQECLKEPNTFTYAIGRERFESLREYLKPFGQFAVSYDDGLIMRGSIIDPGDRLSRITMKLVRTDGSLRVTFCVGKNVRLLKQRYEKQIRKFQSCVLCGACASHCPSGAIITNGVFKVDESKCTGCLRCVSSDCIVVKAVS